MKKKGISAIVATVLIILITVAAVTIIWAAIIPMINNQLDRGIVCLDAVQQITLKEGGYTCKPDGNSVSLQIKHGSEDIDLADIQVLVSAGGSTDSYSLIDPATTTSPALMTVDLLPGPNEEKAYVIDTSAVTGIIDKIEIAPIVTVGNTQETCDVSASVTLRDC
ncbi:hypothetical protein HNV12_00700 [Methanococcoides sp. SA1]|nr:hypothetical protein [Methanococcoides sp. SA1]